MTTEVLQKLIIELLSKVKDPVLLDLIYKLLLHESGQ